MSAGASGHPRLREVLELVHAERLNQARSITQRLLAASPGDAAAHDVMRDILTRLKLNDQALIHARRAYELAPENPRYVTAYAVILGSARQYALSEEIAQHAVRLAPENLLAYRALWVARLNLYKLPEARQTLEEARARFPGETDVGNALCSCLCMMGMTDEAANVMSQLAIENPGDDLVLEGLANVLNYAWTATGPRITAAHRNIGRLLAHQRMVTVRKYAGLDPDKTPLRVGIIGTDLYEHPVAFFLAPLIEHLPALGFEIILYDANPREDQFSARLRALGLPWRVIASDGLEELEARLAGDALDVVIDTNGLTLNNRLQALVTRPAPLQVTYLGYPNTTGCEFMDVRLVDAITDPPGSEDQAVERLERIEGCFLCYGPPVPREQLPSCAPAPRPAGVGVRFGSFNNFLKISDPLLGLWARVLGAVPGSTLVLKNVSMDAPSSRAALAARAQRAGIDPARLTLLGKLQSVGGHLGAYAQVDVALDTYPYHGTTTTCESLLMGVPVVTMVGDRHASRVGASLLHAVGLDELVTHDPDAYVRVAASLAGDHAKLSAMRSTLRDRLLGSSLCDGAGYAQRFADALRRSWRWRCGR